MSAPIIYRSGDASAPVLTGTAGDLVNLLDKCLVDGYGSKAGAGWSKAYTATNQRVYRQGAGNQFYLDVDDRGASGVLTGASGKEAAVRGYETVSAVSTGTNLFPTTAQIAAATANWRKSATADSFPRGWLVAADDRTFYLFILDGDTANGYKGYTFGDFYSLVSGDSYRTCVITRTSVNSTSTNGSLTNGQPTPGAAIIGFYVPRVSAGTGSSINAGYYTLGSGGFNPITFPGNSFNLFVGKAIIGENSTILRGWLRGLYVIQNFGGINDGDTFLGTGDFAGRAFLSLSQNTTLQITFAIETTTWDAN